MTAKKDDTPQSNGEPAAPVLARVLVQCSWGSPDDVVEIPADQVEGAAASGQVDTHPDAVAYALSLKA